MSEALLGVLSCMLKASFESHRRHHECWQSIFPSGWRALLYIYLLQIKVILDLTGSRCGLCYHISLLPCVCWRQRSDGWRPKPSFVGRNIQELFLVEPPNPPRRTHLWVKMSPLCPPAIAGREGTAISPSGRSEVILSPAKHQLRFPGKLQWICGFDFLWPCST